LIWLNAQILICGLIIKHAKRAKHMRAILIAVLVNAAVAVAAVNPSEAFFNGGSALRDTAITANAPITVDLVPNWRQKHRHRAHNKAFWERLRRQQQKRQQTR
jgi:hypothetical protein